MKRDRAFAVRLEAGFAMLILDDESLDLRDVEAQLLPEEMDDLDESDVVRLTLCHPPY